MSAPIACTINEYYNETCYDEGLVRNDPITYNWNPLKFLVIDTTAIIRLKIIDFSNINCQHLND